MDSRRGCSRVASGACRAGRQISPLRLPSTKLMRRISSLLGGGFSLACSQRSSRVVRTDFARFISPELSALGRERHELTRRWSGTTRTGSGGKYTVEGPTVSSTVLTGRDVSWSVNMLQRCRCLQPWGSAPRVWVIMYVEPVRMKN